MYAESGQLGPAMLCMSQGTHPVMLPTASQTQLLAVQQDIQDVKAELQQVKQDLATARADNDTQEVDFLRKRVESIDKQLSCLREKDNILLRDQLGGKAREASHGALVPSPSAGQKRQRQGRHSAGNPPGSMVASGLQSRPSGANAAPQKAIQSAMPHSSVPSRPNQHRSVMPQMTGSLGPAGFIQQPLTWPQSAEAQGGIQHAPIASPAAICAAAPAAAPPAVVPPAVVSAAALSAPDAVPSTAAAAAPPTAATAAPAIEAATEPAAPSSIPHAVFSSSVPSPAPVAGFACLDQLPVTEEERHVVLAPQAPHVPPGLFRGVQPMGHGKGGDDGLKTCRACCGKCTGFLVRCTGAHKGKDKQCDRFAQQLRLWQLWYSCRGLDWLSMVPVPVMKNNKWFLEMPVGPNMVHEGTHVGL